MKKTLLAFVLMLAVSVMAMAQVTTSALSGMVTDEYGEVIGANIQAVHTPSGTRYLAVTNAKGTFAIRGMRVGGPYTITVSYVGAQTQKVEGVTLALGETYNINIKLKENIDALSEVVVTASGSKFNTLKTGASTNINNAQMVEMPTVGRGITEFTRLSPYGGNGMTFSGSDGRTANFTVDGADFNNNFGLSSGLPGGGNPISMDAIEEMQVVISPYDVRQTNFIGGGVNAITKSGTNTFKGSAYIYHKNENMQGDAVDREQIQGMRDKNNTRTYGFTLGGPIVKDKLFFFVNYEDLLSNYVVNRWHGSENGVADADNYISRTKLSDLQAVSEYAMSRYGYDTGSWTDFPAEETNRKILARLDWNINANHHLALRYNHTKNVSWKTPSATSMDGGTAGIGARASQYSMLFSNAMYRQNNLVNTVSLDLNSRFSNKVSNQFLATFSKLDDVRGSNSSEFPFIDILDGSGEGVNYMCLGYELFTWNNAVHNTVANVKDDVTIYLGAHKLTAGLSYEYQMADNIYMRNGTGYYRYRSVEDFLNDGTPEIVNLTYGYGGESKPASRITYNKLGLYLQDTWQVHPRFNLTAGIRFDDLIYKNSDLVTNNAILNLDYYGRHVDTGKWPDSSITISPRVGFTYDVLGNKSLVVRGGTGLFMGRLPLVFLTNMPTNSGMFMYQAQINEKNAAARGFTMDEFRGGLVKEDGKSYAQSLKDKLVSLGYPTNITPEEGAVPQSVCAVDPGFKMPQVWKSSIAVDYSFPTSFPLSISGEFIFNKTINDVCLIDWSIPDVGGFSRLNGVDNRALYPAGYRNNPKTFVLENTSKGYGWMGSITVNARPTEYLSFMASYTHSAKKEVSDMPGSNAESAFRHISSVEGPNNLRLHNAANLTPDRFILSGTFHDKCGNHLGLIYEAWRGGWNYSYMTTNDINGDGYNYDAIYIPTDKEVADRQFRFVSDDDRDRFMAYVHKDDYLKNHQGEYAEAFSVYNPWVHRVDLSYKHDFKLCIGNTTNKLQLSFDIKNLLNLFDSTLGVMKQMNQAYTSNNEARILKYEGVDADGYGLYSTPKSISGDTKIWSRAHTNSQCWYASIGARYIFEGKRSSKDCGCDAAPTISMDEYERLLEKNKELLAANNRLSSENQELKNRPAKVIKEAGEKTVVSDRVMVEFAQNSAVLTDASKASLDKIERGATVTIVGATSPEGSVRRNKALSQERANAVADYLSSRGVKVKSATGNEAGRIAVVSIM